MCQAACPQVARSKAIRLAAARDGLQAGMNDFVTKPTQADRLYESALKWLGVARP